jgi:cytosine/creatinine deaminase
MSTWILEARTIDGPLVDVQVDATSGLISAVEPHSTGTGRTGIRLHGALLVPAAAEPHAHLDKVLTAQLVPNPAGDLMGAISGWTAFFPSLTKADMVRRATQAVHELVSSGITAIRSHVNVHEGIDLLAMEALLEVRDACADMVDLQLVSLTGWVTGDGNDANRRLLRDSVLMDPAIVVGGCPHLDSDPRAATDIALDLAGELNRQLDLHTDENLEPTSEDLRYLSERVIATGYNGVAVASHCCSLATQDLGRQRDTAAVVAQANVSVIALPQTNLFLQSRDHHVRPPRGLTAIAVLRNAGVNVAAGADNVRDPFNSMGRHDPCETASLMVMAGHLLPADAWSSVTDRARVAMALPPIGLEVGAPADLVSLEGADLADAIARGDQQRRVWHHGRLVALTTVTREPIR